MFTFLDWIAVGIDSKPQSHKKCHTKDILGTVISYFAISLSTCATHGPNPLMSRTYKKCGQCREFNIHHRNSMTAYFFDANIIMKMLTIYAYILEAKNNQEGVEHSAS